MLFIQIEESLDLTEKLGSMGIVDLFSDAADLTGVTTDVPLQVSKVVHKSFIEVNEEGAEAAAATGKAINEECGRFLACTFEKKKLFP